MAGNVRLLLTEPDWESVSNYSGEAGKQWVQNLKNLETKLSSLIMSTGRSEARLWLSHAVSGITGLSHREKKDLFLTLLKRKPRNRTLAGQLLQLMFQTRPEKAGSILQRRSHLLERFFDGHPKRIAEWFSHFSIDERGDHKRGAKALSQFAFSNRDICWDELDWKGKHGQSPVVVASKPYYLLDLDIQNTIQNFIDNVPEFWSSYEFSQSLKNGDIVSIDTNFFEDFFLGLMFDEDSDHIWDSIVDFLQESQFPVLCRHLLITLNEEELYSFLSELGGCLRVKGGVFGANWLELLLSKKSAKMGELLMLNAVINEGNKLLKMADEEEFSGLKEELLRVQRVANNVGNIGPLLAECSKMTMVESMKLLGLQMWALFCVLSQGSFSWETWEDIFYLNHIKFEKSKEYGIIEENGSSDENLSKRKKRKREEREKLIDEEIFVNKKDKSWLLSTDQYSASWATADLPEHLSKYCFNLWMKWLQK